MNDKKVLILGGSGFLGQSLVKFFGSDRCAFTYHSNKIDGGLKFDISQDKLADLELDFSEFSHVFILGANSRINDCFKNFESAKKLNVENTIRIIDESIKLNLIPVFSSTDLVFDGSEGDYSVDSKTNAIVAYGKFKEEVEQYLIQNIKDFRIIRISKVLSHTYGQGSFLDQWYDAIKSKNCINCIEDFYFTPIEINDFLKQIDEVLTDSNLINHICGIEKVNRVDLFHKFAKEWKTEFNEDILNYLSIVKSDSMSYLETMPINVSMQSTSKNKDSIQSLDVIIQKFFKSLK